ncbi:MAG TPA: hypothetical protein PKG60_06640 [Spirochaetota bacterium]|nr:hypothetical protein [Spirochaetota bacterium]HPS86611.1 hypothetical protein [Spirochaetota bacterium]
MKKRSYIIDKKFQYGKSLRVVGAVTILLAVVIMAVGLMISINNGKTAENNKLIMNNIDNIKNILDLQQSIYMKFATVPYGVDEKTFTKIAVELTKDYNTSTRNLNASSTANEEIIKSNNSIITTNTYLIIAVIIVTLSGLGILFTLLIRYTHRISGPIYLMTMYGNEILNGGKPKMRNLRDKDEFDEFYNLFRQMAKKIIENEK